MIYLSRLQQGFFSSANHQLLDKLVSETNLTSTSNVEVLWLFEEAEKSKLLLPKLQEEVRISDQHPIEMRLCKMADEFSVSVNAYLVETMDTLLKTGVDQCPKILGNQIAITELRKNCQDRVYVSNELIHRCIVNRAGAEITNKIR